MNRLDWLDSASFAQFSRSLAIEENRESLRRYAEMLEFRGSHKHAKFLEALLSESDGGVSRAALASVRESIEMYQGSYQKADEAIMASKAKAMRRARSPHIKDLTPEELREINELLFNGTVGNVAPGRYITRDGCAAEVASVVAPFGETSECMQAIGWIAGHGVCSWTMGGSHLGDGTKSDLDLVSCVHSASERTLSEGGKSYIPAKMADVGRMAFFRGRSGKMLSGRIIAAISRRSGGYHFSIERDGSLAGTHEVWVAWSASAVETTLKPPSMVGRFLTEKELEEAVMSVIQITEEHQILRAKYGFLLEELMRFVDIAKAMAAANEVMSGSIRTIVSPKEGFVPFPDSAIGEVIVDSGGYRLKVFVERPRSGGSPVISCAVPELEEKITQTSSGEESIPYAIPSSSNKT